jgi:peptide/nickel transport system substrate-binding protein
MYEDRALIAPPETVAAGADKWQNQIGTGAFMFEEYVVGSHMSFVRNPDYWNHTTIDGKKYQMPFADRVVRPIIPDMATQMAALQTGKLDIGRSVLNTYWSMFDSKASKMKMLNFSSGQGYRIYIRCDEPPFDNVNVRRAAAIGTNLMEFKRSAMVEDTPLLFYPVIPGDPSYIPLEKLPKNIQVLFKYDPEQAKKMLAQEGYPNGFKTKLYIDAEQTPWRDKAALLKDQWSKIGIDVEIVAEPNAVYKDRGFPLPEVKYHGLYTDSGGNANPSGSIDVYLRSSGLFNRSMYRNQQLDDIMSKLDVELDTDRRISMIHDILLLALPDVDQLQLHYDSNRTYWWPWVKNYYGELTLQDDGSFAALFPFIWIDQDLKKSMGY